MIENVGCPCGEVEKLNDSSLLNEILLTLSKKENRGRSIPLKFYLWAKKKLKKTLSPEEKNNLYDIINKGQIS